jgi:hypothetical protein
MLHLKQLEDSDRARLCCMNEGDRRREDQKYDSTVALCLTAMSLGVVVAFLWAWRQILQMWSGT